MMHILLSHWVVHLYGIVMAILAVLWIWFSMHPPRVRTPGPGMYPSAHASGARMAVLRRNPALSRRGRLYRG